MNERRTLTVPAPAKINLGLEILRKRDDGYHEIRTILAVIGLADTLMITIVPQHRETVISGIEGVPQPENLIQKAIDAFEADTGIRSGYDITVEKRIPSPGGLGGASSNAASTLKALNAMHGTPLPPERLQMLAGRLGADVPFYLGSPIAYASGTGTTLQPLPQIDAHIVLVAPPLDLPRETARLYGALRREDFTDGRRVQQAAAAIATGELPDAGLLHNAFARPLYELRPELRDLARTMLNAGAPHVALSGAGPAHFVVYRNAEEAHEFARALAGKMTDETLVLPVPISSPPTVTDPSGA